MKKIIFVLASLLAFALFAGCSNDSEEVTNPRIGVFTATAVNAAPASGSGTASASVISTATGSVLVGTGTYKLTIPINYKAAIGTSSETLDGVSAEATITVKDGAYYNGDTKLSVSGSLADKSFTIAQLSIRFGLLTKSTITFTNLAFTKTR